VIGPFRGEYEFLSNFYSSRFVLGTVWYGSVEHFYQSCKAIDSEDRIRIYQAPTPGEAKRIGRSVLKHPEFERSKRAIMLAGVAAKFAADRELSDRLLATGDEWLCEVNTWGDMYWGVCQGQGQNWLGKTLMTVREYFR
jgi:N-glycosidase YbiA